MAGPAGQKPIYKYALAQCEVQDKRALEAFRAKREQWLTWLRHDEHHAISTVISSMLWSDASFRAIAYSAELETTGALNNQIIMQKLISGHFATQTLAIRRLMEDSRTGAISLVNLLKDMARNIDLFTRENFVCLDGLPYDPAEAEQRVIAKHAGGGAFWGDTEGPDAWGTSERAHAIFDKLSGAAPDKRQRHDRIPVKCIETLQGWLNSSDAESIVGWTHNYLAHAADRHYRERYDAKAIQPNLNKITAIIRAFVRVAEALLAHLLFDSGHGSVMPVPQFNQLEFLDQPVLTAPSIEKVHQRWDELAKERDGFLDNVLEEMLS